MLINSPNISGSLKVTGNAVITGSLTVLGGINATIEGTAATASYVQYSNIDNKPALVSGSGQIAAFGFATTGSNQFKNSQVITGSLTVTGQITAQTLNVQQVTSSIIYSSGSNRFGNSLSNTQQLTGSVSITGSMNVNGTPVSVGTGAAGQVAFWNGTNSQTGDTGLTWDNTNKRLGVGTNAPAYKTQINSAASSLTMRLQADAGINPTLSFLRGLTDVAQINGAFDGLQLNGFQVIRFDTVATERWRINIGGVFESNGAQTIRTSTGNLTLATGGGNGNILLTPNGTGNVGINTVTPAAKLEISSTTESLRISGKSSANIANDLYINRSSSGTSAFSGPNIRLDDSTLNNNIAIQNSQGNLGIWNFSTGSWVQRFVFTNTNNFLINTTTDAGFRLDVNGSTRFNGLSTIQGTTASDSGQLGAELLTTGTGDASWTGTSFATGYTHVAGSTTTLTSTLAGVVNTFYQITYTVTGRTAGSFTIAFGGITSAPLTATGAVGPRATTTGTLVITPTSDFDGTIVLSIRVISASSASVTFNSSAGTVSNQIRISSSNTNVFFGINNGFRNTTGIANTFIGSQSGIANTTGFNNTFIGERAGVSNETGSGNSFFGRFSGFSNISGGTNTFIGAASGFSNTTGFQNSFFGASSGLGNTTGSNNSFFGVSSGQNNTTGIANTFIGVEAAFNLTTGSNNTIIGRNAGRFAGSGTTAMTSVDNSIYLGFQTRGLNATGSTNELVIGYNVVGLGSNTTVLGNSSTTHGRWYGSLLLGTTTNAASSILTMDSTTQGFLPPRMTATQRNAIASPATGLIVYQTDGVEGLYVRTSTGWRALAIV